MKLKNLFYTEKYISDGTMGSYKKTPTRLTDIIGAIVAFLSIIGFAYLLLIFASLYNN